MKAVNSSDKSVNVYQTTCCNILGASILHCHCCDNLKSHNFNFAFTALMHIIWWKSSTLDIFFNSGKSQKPQGATLGFREDEIQIWCLFDTVHQSGHKILSTSPFVQSFLTSSCLRFNELVAALLFDSGIIMKHLWFINIKDVVKKHITECLKISSKFLTHTESIFHVIWN
jgi:hypothetical protein